MRSRISRRRVPTRRSQIAFMRGAGLAPLARVVLLRRQPAVPGQQRRWRHGEDFGPAPARYKPRQGGEPGPVGLARTVSGRRAAAIRAVQDQLPQTRLRLGPHPPRRPTGGSDLVRARGAHPQPGQDRRPCQLARHGPAAAQHQDRTQIYHDDFFRAK